MSDTLLNVEDRIRSMLRDVNPDLPAVIGTQLRTLINARVQTMPGVELGEDWTDNFLTLVPGTSDYTLSSTSLENVRVLRLHSLRWVLQRISQERMTVYKTGTAVSQGNPTQYSIWEDSAQLIKIRLFPEPQVADTLDKFGAVLPTAVVNDTDTIPFPPDLLRALEYMVAGTALALPQATALVQGSNAKQEFDGLGREALYWAKVRRNRMQRVGYQGVS